MKTITVYCAVNCPDGKAPSENVVSKAYREIELYAIQQGYKGLIEERQWWGLPQSPGVDANAKDWAFCIYRDYPNRIV